MTLRGLGQASGLGGDASGSWTIWRLSDDVSVLGQVSGVGDHASVLGTSFRVMACFKDWGWRFSAYGKFQGLGMTLQCFGTSFGD